MYKRTMTVITLGLTAALGALPAQAKTEALLIGTSRTADALVELGNTLKTAYGVDEVQVATAGAAHEVAERVRGFLATPGKPGELRLIWVEGGSDACPGFDEAPVRPQARTLVVAPTCLKLLVQAPTTYERLGAEGQDDRSSVDPRTPALAFISLNEVKTRKPIEVLAKATGPLAQALACSLPEQTSLDFSPSVSSWGVNRAGCQMKPQMAAAPPPSPPPAVVPEPEKAPVPEAKREAAAPTPAPAPVAQGSEFRLAAPVKGRVVSAFGSQDGGKPNKGIDLEVPAGTTAKSAEAGEVVYVGDLPGYGKVVAIKHDNDWATVYARTVNPRVAQGQKVAKGQDLADIDPAANRLHFEVRRKGKPMDPEPLLTSG